METPSPAMKKCKIAGESPKLVFMFEFEKKNLSSVEEHVMSDKCKVGGLSWRLILDKNKINESDVDVLSVYLMCEGKSKFWCCFARVILSIISQKEGVPNYEEKFETLYSSLKDNVGMDLMKWTEVINPEKGYVKNDTIKIQVRVAADAPQNIDADYKKERPQSFDDWLSTFETEINEKLVRRISEELKETHSLIKEGLKTSTISKENWKNYIKSAVEPINTRMNALEKCCHDYFKKISELLEDVKSKEKEVIGKNNIKESEDCNKKRKDREEEVEEMRKPKTSCAGDRDVYSEQQRRPLRSPCPVGVRAYYRFNELCSYPLTDHESQACGLPYGGFYPPVCEHGSPLQSSRDQPDCFAEKKCLLVKGGNISSSNAVQNEVSKNEKSTSIAKDEKNDHESDATPVSFSKLKLSKPSIPCEEEEVDINEDLTKPMDKNLLLIGKDDDGDVTTHKVTSLKELFDLKKKYSSTEVLEINKDE